MKGKECSVLRSIFLWREDLALNFNDRWNRWKVTWKPNEQRDFRPPLPGSQGGNEAAEKQLSIRKEADRSNRQAFQEQPGGEQTSSCSQWKPAGQAAPELAVKPSRPSGSRSCVPPSVQRRGTLASPRDPARSVTPRLDGGRMLVYMPAFPAAKAARPTPPSLGKVPLGADPQTLEMGCAGKSRIWGLILVSRGSIFHTFSRIINGPMQQWKMQPSLTWLAFIREDPAWQRHGLPSCRFIQQQHWRIEGLHLPDSVVDERQVSFGSWLFPIESKEEIILGPLAGVTLVTDFTSSLL